MCNVITNINHAEDSVSLKTEQICQSKIMHIYEKRKTNYKHTKQ